MMRMLRFLLEKEFKQIARDRFMPKILFIIPVMQLVILPLAANFEMRGINLAVVDHDRSVISRQLVGKILSSGYFLFSGMPDSYADALGLVERDAADIILEIPRGFGRDLGREGSARVLIAPNAVNGTRGGIGGSYLSSILQDFNREKGFVPDGAGRGIRVANLFNPHLDYKVYMVPGIMVFLLTIIGGFLAALSIVIEKERGTIEQINVSPVPRAVFLLSKLVPAWVIGLALLTVAITVARLVYGLVPEGSLGVVYLFAAVYLVAFTGLGLAVSSFSSTQQQAMFTIFFLLIVFSLLSGLFTPIGSMPEWARRLTLLNPLRYFVEVMRMVYLKGSGLADLRWHFAVTCLFALLFNALAVLAYRKRE